MAINMTVVLGAGFLGAYLLKCLSEKKDETLLAVGRNQVPEAVFRNVEYIKCDITSREDVELLAKRLSGEELTVFWFAAMHNVDYLFEHPEEGRAVNIDALSFFLKTVPGIKKFFFASTDCVYGENPPDINKFGETDRTLPINEYGRQKLEAEKTALSCGGTVVRFSYMLGPSLLKKRHFYDIIRKKLEDGDSVEMIDGMVRSSLSYKTAADLLSRLSLTDTGCLGGIYNLCSDGEYGKYDLGLLIANEAGAPKELVKKITEEQAKSFFKDKRASRSVMDNSKLKSLLGIKSISLEL